MRISTLAGFEVVRKKVTQVPMQEISELAQIRKWSRNAKTSRGPASPFFVAAFCLVRVYVLRVYVRELTKKGRLAPALLSCQHTLHADTR